MYSPVLAQFITGNLGAAAIEDRYFLLFSLVAKSISYSIFLAGLESSLPVRQLGFQHTGQGYSTG